MYALRMSSSHLRHLLAALISITALSTLNACAVPTEDTPSRTGDKTASASKGQKADKPKTGKADKPKTNKADKPKTNQTGKNRANKAPQSASTSGTALAALAALPVKGRAPMTGYDRDQFGTEWSDAAGDFPWSRNGCDTRNDVLARDLQREVVESNGCVVTSGVLAYEPYTGVRDYYFDSQDGEFATDLDAEHIVALGNAWVTGAQQLSEDERARLANSPLNVMMTNPSENRSKGDADFATWLPPNKAFRCSYAARQIAVKTEFSLWVTAPEKAAMERVLATCPNEPLVQPDPQDGYTVGKSTQQADKTEAPAPATTPQSAGKGRKGGRVYYATCSDAEAAGAAPVRKGDPGYGTHLDGDGDGSACE